MHCELFVVSHAAGPASDVALTISGLYVYLQVAQDAELVTAMHS